MQTTICRGLALALCLGAMLANPAGASPETPNRLERKLSEAQQDEQAFPAFMQELMDSEVVMLSKKQVLEQRSPDDIPALIIPDKANGPGSLAIFTSEEMAHRVAATYPEYRYGIRIDFLWVLAHTAPGLGVSINPGWTLGMQIPAYGVLRLRDRFADRIEAATRVDPQAVAQ